MSNTRLLSGRAVKKLGNELATDRYEFLDLASAEPDLGNPTANGSILISSTSGQRSWSNSITVGPNGAITLASLSVIGPADFNDLLVKGKLTVIGDIVGGPLRTDDIQIVGNRIETTQSNSNFEIETAGTGQIELLAPTNIRSDLTVDQAATVNGATQINDTLTVTDKATFQDDVDIVGDLKVDGSITLGGNITIGDQNVDTVNVVADFTSNLVPDQDNTYDLGTTVSRWRFLYGNNIDIDGMATLNDLTVNGDAEFNGNVSVQTLEVEKGLEAASLKTDDIQISGNRIETTQSNSNFEVHTAGSGTIELNAPTNVNDELTVSDKATFQDDVDIVGDLKVDGNITLGGNITIGDQTVDTVNVVADFTSNLIPKDDVTYNLGSTIKRWNNLYSQTVNSTTGNFNNISVSGTTNLNSLSVNTSVQANKFQTDDIQISGNRIETTQSNSNFEIHTSGTGSVNVFADTTINGNLTSNKVITNQFETLSSPYLSINSNSSIKLPAGDTSQRPLDGVAGQLRYNSFLSQFEGYNGIEWYSLGTYGALAFSVNGDDSVPAYVTFGGNLQVLGTGGTNTYVDGSGNLTIHSKAITVYNSSNTVMTPSLGSIKFTGPGVTVSNVGDAVTVDINVSNLYNLGANIDGGSVESIYLFTQNLDGGVPYANFAQTGSLDAGGVV